MDENEWRYHGEGNKSLVVAHAQVSGGRSAQSWALTLPPGSSAILQQHSLQGLFHDPLVPPALSRLVPSTPSNTPPLQGSVPRPAGTPLPADRFSRTPSRVVPHPAYPRSLG